MRINKKAAVFITLLAVVTVLMVIYGVFFVRGYPLKYLDEIQRYSDEFSVPAELVCAVINNESGFDPTAKSHKGALGLMQIMPSTGEWIAGKLGEAEYDLHEPETSIRYGAYYLSYLYGIFGNTEVSIAAYNAGPGRVTEWLGMTEYSENGTTLKYIPYGDTREYVRRVMRDTDVYASKLE